MIDTFSKFYYGTTITRGNRFLNFSEGGPELTLELSPSSYTLDELTGAIEAGLNATGALTYLVTVDRSLRQVTISADGNFELLVLSGTQLSQSVFGTLGFTGADLSGANTYTGNGSAGSEYMPQFKLQSFVDASYYSQGVSTVINKTAEGQVEIVTFGRESFYEMDIKFITNLPMDGYVIKNNANGLQDAIDFMNDITNKTRFEFMKDASNPNVFSKVILESSPGFSDGTGYKLKELIGDNLRDVYETGVLKMRVVS